MSNAKHETLADIVAEMRVEAHAGDASCLEWVGAKLRHYADRIEAAHKREVEATTEKSSAVGNAAAMREALEKVRFYLPYFLQYVRLHDAQSGGYYEKKLEVVAADISAPPRNCDVGTAEEQAERFAEYCDSEACKRNRCKSRAKALCIERCAIAWAQMPYEEGDAK